MATKDLLGSLATAAVKAATSKSSGTDESAVSNAASGVKDLLTSAAMQAITSQVTSKAKGLSDSGLDLNGIVTTLVGACADKSNIDYTKIATAIANIWNAAYKAGGNK